MIGVIVILLIILIGGGALVYIGIRAPQNSDDDLIQERLEEFLQKGEQVDLEKLEMSRPFTERVLYPVARKLGQVAAKFTPQNALNSIAMQLERAGNPGRLDPTLFLALQFIALVFFGGVILLVFSVGQTKMPFGRILLFALLFGMLGFFFPRLWVTSKINRRQKSIRRALPDALDLLTICVEAGLGFDAAMQKVSNKWETELSLAFARVIKEVQLGKLRRDALRDMSDKIGIPELTSFVAAVIQSEQLGVSLAKVLRIQSDQMRMKRRQHAEEEAHKAPVKMLIPMVLLIFPSLIIVLLTPAALKLMSSSLGSMFK
ncbi:MAG: type II secretion system F family protein [Anaerolineaceae bacterium]|jgi:tight adherence protein C